MALNKFRFACNEEKLNELLSYALAGIVQSNLDRLDMPAMTPSLDLLYAHRGLSYEDEVEFYFLPHGNGIKNAPIDFVVISDLLFNPGEAGLYSYDEFARGLCMELMKQSEGNDARREGAMKLVQRYGLQKYTGN
ncbi:hypothetical protein [Variovorax sp. R-27]|uniref:hypothetical protein n=1 Tax=Variovorax sp. R-27 TaxID=3404058 RepID=UPI003CEDC98E